jgi:hypothetical protein
MELVNIYKTSRGIFNTEADAMKNRAWDHTRYGEKIEKETVVVQPVLKVDNRYFLLTEIAPK